MKLSQSEPNRQGWARDTMSQDLDFIKCAGDLKHSFDKTTTNFTSRNLTSEEADIPEFLSTAAEYLEVSATAIMADVVSSPHLTLPQSELTLYYRTFLRNEKHASQ